jgi:hypothetical protein
LGCHGKRGNTARGKGREKKLDEKFDPVVTKLDGILKGVEALQQERNSVPQQMAYRHRRNIFTTISS